MSLTNSLLLKYKPELAIMVYHSYPDSYYLEAHNINEAGQILNGQPLKQDTLNAIVDVFFDERKTRERIEGMIPQNLVYFNTTPGGSYDMIWFRPAEIRMMYFAEQLHINNGNTWVPAMIYSVSGNELSVYALGSDSRPNENSKLLLAPYHNVYDDGRVCLGNASVKKAAKKTYDSEMKYWEDMFWLSEFTHLHGNDNPTVTNINTLWKKMIASKQKLKWNKLELKPYKNFTLKSLLK